ncbi:MAG: hypothetical protein AB7T86_04695 [Xanthobacteraceae bacterium]|uniref:hypothetical protein n=1 Tax=Pseudolabrys sp. TaxID=1960880 RepID=UPI003D0FD42C
MFAISGAVPMEIATALISALSGLIGVALGGWLTFRNASKEKLIELRRNTYGSILHELSQIQQVIDVADECISHVGWDRYFTSETEQQHTQKIVGHMSELRKKSSAEYLIISDGFRNLLDEMNKEMSSSDAEYYEEDDTFDRAIAKYRPLLLAQAKKEVIG